MAAVLAVQYAIVVYLFAIPEQQKMIEEASLEKEVKGDKKAEAKKIIKEAHYK